MDTLLLLELTDNLTEALAQLEQAKDDTLATLDAIDAVNEALIALGGESVEAIVTDYTALLKQIVNDEINIFESKEKMQDLEFAVNALNNEDVDEDTKSLIIEALQNATRQIAVANNHVVLD